MLSTIDLKSAYQLLSLKVDDKIYTAFEACGRLYQFTLLPFGVANGVAYFQRIMMQLVEKVSTLRQYHRLWNSKEDHNKNLQKFIKATEWWNLFFNKSKTVLTIRKLSILGYEIFDGHNFPYPKRLKPLRKRRYSIIKKL